MSRASEFVLVGRHPQELTGGRVLTPGEACELTSQEQEDHHNADLIERGVLISNSKKREEGGTE